MGVHAGSGKVFNWFANMTSVAGLMTWFGISWTYIRFHAGMKAQGIDRKTLPFYSSLQPYAAWYATVSCLVICLVRFLIFLYAFIRLMSKKQKRPLTLTNTLPTQFSGWDVFLRGHWNTANFITNYFPFVLFPVLYISAKYWTRVPAVRPVDMDFYTGLAEIEADTYDEPPPKNRLEAFWQWLVSNPSRRVFRMRPLIVLLIDVSKGNSKLGLTTYRPSHCNIRYLNPVPRIAF